MQKILDTFDKFCENSKIDGFKGFGPKPTPDIIGDYSYNKISITFQLIRKMQGPAIPAPFENSWFN